MADNRPTLSGKTTTIVHKSRTTIWLVGSAFSASLLPMLICTVWTVVWFIMFALPFADWFPALFPVAQFMWFVLLYAIAQAGILMHLRRLQDDIHRRGLFSQFRSRILGLVMADTSMPTNVQNALRKLPSMYVMAHREMHDANRETKDATQRSLVNAVSVLGSVDSLAPGELIRLWFDSVSIEQQSRPVILYTLGYVSVWLFVLSVPLVLWGAYNWYGLFGLLLVDWPLLAFIHGAGRKTHAYESYERSAFITTDYDALARECTDLVNMRLSSN